MDLLRRSLLIGLTHTLHKCRKERDVSVALHLVTCMCEDGLDRHLLLANQIVSLMVEIGSICNAQQLFDRLVYRSEEAWNALIIGYIQCGKPVHACSLYHRLCYNGYASPLSQTSVAVLNVCGKLQDLKKGEEIHENIDTMGLLKRDVFVGSALVDMYTKCASLEKAYEVFNALPVRNVVTWTTLITGYVEHGHGKEAIELFHQMHAEGVSPNPVTFVCVLKACSLTGDRDKGQETHVELERLGLLDSNPFVASALVDMYAKCGSLMKARQVFDGLSSRNAVCWTALLAGYTEQNCCQEAVQLFKQMQTEGVYPDLTTLVCALKACGRAGSRGEGLKIHAHLDGQGLLQKDLFVCSTLVDMYAKCGSITKARIVFDRLQVRSLVSWNALIAGYVEAQQGEEALKCFQQMQLENVTPSAVTFICTLQACASIGATDKGEEIHGEIERRGLLARDLVGNTLINMYAKCGALEKAHKVFNKLPVRDIFSFTTLMEGYAQLGDSEPVFNMFDRMLGEGVKPNFVTFIVLLSVCSRTGLFAKSHTYFEAMTQNFGICSTLAHHSCMVDLLSRAGQADKALEVIKKMKELPDLAMWHALLSACRKGGNVTFAEHVFDRELLVDGADTMAAAKGAEVKYQRFTTLWNML